jgi:hypothetical protein
MLTGDARFETGFGAPAWNRIVAATATVAFIVRNRDELLSRYTGIVGQCRRPMDKRLAKRHKRQVSRAKEHVKLSEPDLRTPEQIKAAREASRPAGGHGGDIRVSGSAPSTRNNPVTGTHSAAKTDA